MSRNAIGGAVVLGALGATVLWAAAMEAERVLAVALGLLLTLTALLALASLMTQRRTARNVALIVRRDPSRNTERLIRSAPEVEKADLLGVIRMMQAQYLGRLDRAQESLDRAAARMYEGGSETPGPWQEESAVLTLSRGADHHAALVDAAIAAGVPVVVEGGGPDLEAWIERHGWSGRVYLDRSTVRTQERTDGGSVSSGP